MPLVQIEVLVLAALARHHLIPGLPSPTLEAELVVLILELAQYLAVRAEAGMADMTPPLLQVERQIAAVAVVEVAMAALLPLDLAAQALLLFVMLILTQMPQLLRDRPPTQTLADIKSTHLPPAEQSLSKETP